MCRWFETQGALVGELRQHVSVITFCGAVFTGGGGVLNDVRCRLDHVPVHGGKDLRQELLTSNEFVPFLFDIVETLIFRVHAQAVSLIFKAPSFTESV